MNVKLLAALAAASTLLLTQAACSAPGAPSAAGGGLVPGPPAPASDGLVHGVVSISVGLQIDARHPHYVSRSTRSATIGVAPRAGCSDCTAAFSHDLALRTGSKSCQQSVGQTTCTIQIALKPGTYDGTLTTYDGDPGCEKLAAPCNVLSLKQTFPIKVTSTKMSVPTIVLDGVPTGWGFEPIDGDSIVSRYSGNLELGIVGGGTKARVLIWTVDAKGNMILGPGAPKLQVKASNGFGASVNNGVVQFVAPAKMAPGFAPVTVNAVGGGCKAAGANCQLTGHIQFLPFVAVGSPVKNSVMIVPSHHYTTERFATVTNGVSKPAALVFDGAGNLFVANAGTHNVTEYAQPWSGAPIATYTGFTTPALLADEAANNTLAIADASTDSVKTFAPPSTTATATIALPGKPLSMAFDRYLNLWIGTSGEVRRYAPPYTGAPDVTLNGANGINTPVGIAFDGFNRVYVADAGNGQLQAYPSPFTGMPSATFAYPSITGVVGYGYAIAAFGTADIYLLDEGTLQTAVTIPINDATQQFCVLDQNSNLYALDTTYGDVGEWDYNFYEYFGHPIDNVANLSTIAAFPGEP